MRIYEIVIENRNLETHDRYRLAVKTFDECLFEAHKRLTDKMLVIRSIELVADTQL